MIEITRNISIPDDEIEITAMRAQGSGGQNVNKVSSAVHLRFDIRASSLDDKLKLRLLRKQDSRITRDGIIIIKAQRFRSREKNRKDAVERLAELVRGASLVRKPRKPTRPTKASQVKRLESKTRRGRTKALRGRVSE